MSGYVSGLFGTNDPVTREQIATILWRYFDSPNVSNTVSPFSDAAYISSYAVEAVSWARDNSVINGKPGNLFDAKGNATRAEVATIMWNYSSIEQLEPEPKPTPNPEPQASDGMTEIITITIGNAAFAAKLYDNDTARAFQAMLPMTLNMSELNGNEKYYYLPNSQPTDSQQVGSIPTAFMLRHGLYRRTRFRNHCSSRVYSSCQESQPGKGREIS